MNPPAAQMNELAKHFRAREFTSVAERAESLRRDFPESVLLMNVLGAAHLEIGDYPEAQSVFQSALKLQPENPKIHLNLGIALVRQNHIEEGLRALQNALNLNPNYARAHLMIGNAHFQGSNHSEAFTSYHRALKLEARLFEAHVNLGIIHRTRRELPQAQRHFSFASKLKPESADPLFNWAFTLHQFGRMDEAAHAYKNAYSLDPSHTAAKSGRLVCLKTMADWEPIDDLLRDETILEVGGGDMPLMATFYFTDDVSVQHARALEYCASKFPPVADRKKLSGMAEHSQDRIRVGYVSTNFQEHPVMDLTTGLFREHDLSKFEIHAIGYGPIMAPEVRELLEREGACVHDLEQSSDDEFADRIRALNLDIVVDMTGYTDGTKTKVFAHGLAPVQVNYLAYPGTLGSEAFDYIVADETVIGTDQTDHYVEHVMWLPDSFMPCDNQRVISETVKHRAEYGLPEEGFVFCSFNNPVKISPREFDIWMRLLGEIEGSCLWLTGKNKWVPENLRKQAERRGIDPDRLVFTERVPMEEHLARHAHADLFLDTFNYNAHTTANEALWSGLPLVTKIGDQFAARVAASLLRAVGLPELVTQSEAEYEALALALARDPERLSALRTKLQANRLSTALFDTQTYVRNFEAGLAEAHRRRIAGEAVSNIVVSDL